MYCMQKCNLYQCFLCIDWRRVEQPLLHLREPSLRAFDLRAQQVALHTLQFKQGDIPLGGGDPRSSARWLYYVQQLEEQHKSQTQPGETPMTPVVPGAEPAGESETQEEASPELCA